MLNARGFTLMETLVSLALVGVMMAWAMPHFQMQLQRTRRGDAHVALGQVTLAQSSRQMTGLPPSDDFKALGLSAISPAGHYQLHISTHGTGYTVHATALASQAQDSCPQIWVRWDQTGLQRGPNDACWPQ